MFNILFIEDDAIWRSKIGSQLNSNGYEQVRVCTGISEAANFLQKEIPDLIITDIMLEEGDIFELLTRNNYTDIPVIFITASTSEDFFKQSEVFTNATYLVKPFHAISLNAAIKTVMKNYQRILPANPRGILLRGNHNEKLLLPYDEIIYIKSKKNYCYYKTKKAVYLKKISLVSQAGEIGEGFLRVHRCYLVNRRHIQTPWLVNGNVATAAGKVPLGRQYRKQVEQVMLIGEAGHTATG